MAKNRYHVEINWSEVYADARASVTPEWEERYGEHSWNAALACIGEPNTGEATYEFVRQAWLVREIALDFENRPA